MNVRSTGLAIFWKRCEVLVSCHRRPHWLTKVPMNPGKRQLVTLPNDQCILVWMCPDLQQKNSTRACNLRKDRCVLQLSWHWTPYHSLSSELWPGANSSKSKDTTLVRKRLKSLVLVAKGMQQSCYQLGSRLCANPFSQVFENSNYS